MIDPLHSCIYQVNTHNLPCLSFRALWRSCVKRDRERDGWGALLQGCASIHGHGDHGVHQRGLKHTLQGSHAERDELPCLCCLCLCYCCYCPPSCTLRLPKVSLSLSLCVNIKKVNWSWANSFCVPVCMSLQIESASST